MLLSQSVPSFPSPTVSTSPFSSSESLFLPWKYVHQYHFSRFHIYALIYNICFFLISDLLHSLYDRLSVQFSRSVMSDSCNPMNRSTPGPPVHHQLPEFTQTHVHRVGDAIQPSHPLSSPSPPAPNPSQHQSLFQWVNSLHEVTYSRFIHITTYDAVPFLFMAK